MASPVCSACPPLQAERMKKAGYLLSNVHLMTYNTTARSIRCAAVHAGQKCPVYQALLVFD